MSTELGIGYRGLGAYMAGKNKHYRLGQSLHWLVMLAASSIWAGVLGRLHFG